MSLDGAPPAHSTIVTLLEKPMPWIGMYVAAASLFCVAGMAADALHGLLKKKHWFPSKYFSLNATSLTLLAVAMKLPVDLTTPMYTVTDRLAKISTLVFMSTAMANFLTSLGSMSNKDVSMNVTALAILVITVVSNVFIQVVQMHAFLWGRRAFPEELLALASMLLLLVMFISSAVMIPSTKRYLEMKYHEMHGSALDEEGVSVTVSVNDLVMTTDKLRVLIKKYWVMAETSNPQFVIARAATCTTAGVLSLLIALVLLEAEIRLGMEFHILHEADSSYGWSTKFVLLIQTVGVVVGTIAPVSRWFVVIKYRSLNPEGGRVIGSAVKVEKYWTQKMVEWRQSSLSFQIQNLKSRKLVHDLRGQFLKICISVQCLVVRASKLVLVISILLTSPIMSCLDHFRRVKRQNPQVADDSSGDSEVELRPYVILLEGEVELPQEALENICSEVDEVIRRGKTRNPKNLLKLLSKSCSFRGVTEFDSDQVPSLHSQDPPYCWSLPVVTLATIAIALPNVDRNKCNSLLSSVAEGLRLVKVVDKTLDRKQNLANIRTSANVVWVKVELYHKWQDEDLDKTSVKGKNAAEILQDLRDKAEKTVVEFQRGARDCLVRNPHNWPANVIAANAMYRVTTTLLLSESEETGEALFEKICIMIADILAACLTNLARVITAKCHRNAIEKRGKSVRKAALLLGETEEIVALLQQRQLPVLAPNKAAIIEEWRALVKQEGHKNNIQRDDHVRNNSSEAQE